MPDKTIYIRVEDLPLWDSLQNKSAVISKLLNNMNKIDNCKIHQTPLAKGKCLVKGCKYA